MQITKQDLNAAFERYDRALRALGFNHLLTLQEGSKTHGRAYRLFRTFRGQNQYEALGTVNGYLGMTKREAWDMLHSLARTMEDVKYFRENEL